MAVMQPFRCIRPSEEMVSKVASFPYDVYSRKEAKEIVEKNPYSFLGIDRGETQFEELLAIDDIRVYKKASEMIQEQIQTGVFQRDEDCSYYIYALTMNGKTQVGVVGCTSVEDYENEVIKKHENTREDKEMDRINHVDITNMHTGPIFLAYHGKEKLNALIEEVCYSKCTYDFIADSGVRHQVWKVDKTEWVQVINTEFQDVSTLYIADGHHRAASAAKVGQKRKRSNVNHNGSEGYNYFLSVAFPKEQLRILPYHRVLKQVEEKECKELLERLKQSFVITEKLEAYQPEQKFHFGLYVDGRWFELVLKDGLMGKDIVEQLDVSILHQFVLEPIFGICDERTDKRIGFVGGIRGLGELERQVNEGGDLAFSLYPTSMDELIAIADQGLLMPPKSTWFEPKLLSGLFLHELA